MPTRASYLEVAASQEGVYKAWVDRYGHVTLLCLLLLLAR